MNNDSKIIDIKRTKLNTRDTTDPNNNNNLAKFDLYNDGIRWGIAGGVGMALFLVGAQVMTGGDSMILKFFKYMVLAAVLKFGLDIQKSYMKDDYKFKNGIQLGAIMTGVSAITLALMNMFLFWVSENLAFNKFSMDADTIGHVSVLSGVLMFEVLVFGMILSFIILQSIKPKIRGSKK